MSWCKNSVLAGRKIARNEQSHPKWQLSNGQHTQSSRVNKMFKLWGKYKRICAMLLCHIDGSFIKSRDIYFSLPIYNPIWTSRFSDLPNKNLISWLSSKLLQPRSSQTSDTISSFLTSVDELNFSKTKRKEPSKYKGWIHRISKCCLNAVF